MAGFTTSPGSSASTATAPPASPPRTSTSWWRWVVYALVLFALNYAIVALFMPGTAPQRVSIPYTLFNQQVQAANVAAITANGDTIQGRFKQPVSYTPPNSTTPEQVTAFATVQPTFSDPTLLTQLEQQGVVVNATSLDQTIPWWENLLLSFGPTILLIGGFIWLTNRQARQMGGSGGIFGIGRSRATRYDSEDQKRRITFNDVAGIDEAKEELVEIVDFLKDPRKYTRLGGTVPKGVLLVGSPGTGKTLLARAVAGEANVPFFSMGASEFVEMIVGVGASRVRDLFKQAREAAPAIIFIDELDAIGRARGGPAGFGGNSEQEQTLNQILTEMDGFSSTDAVTVLAATNRSDVLDQALLRPGRFDRRVIVQPPDKTGREAILKVHTRNVPLASDTRLAQVASSTPGLVGADLRNLVNEAALLAARRGEDAVHQKDFMDALEKIILGPARPIVLSPAERERVAYHEGGHAILGLVLPGADPVHRVTIQPHGQALGVTYQQPDDDRHNYDEAYLRGRIIGAMGGRAAEEVVYGTRTTGAESDMQQATSIARQMVTRWGMSDKLGPVTLAGSSDGQPGESQPEMAMGGWRAYSDDTARLIDAEIRRVLDDAYAGGQPSAARATTQARLARKCIAGTGNTRRAGDPGSHRLAREQARGTRPRPRHKHKQPPHLRRSTDMSIIQSDPRAQQSAPVSDPDYSPPPPLRRRGSNRGAVVLSIVAAVVIVGGLAVSVVTPSAPGHQFWTGILGGGVSVAASPQASIQQVIQTANSEQSQALASNNPSVLSDTATAAYYRQLVQLQQNMVAQGATSIQLTNLVWGPITVNGTTATANTTETWLTTFSDGTTTESTDTNVYTLVQQNGTWLIEADQQPTPPPASSTPGAQVTPQPQPTPLPAAAAGSGAISHNWSGYAATSGTYTGVTGTWTVPQPSSSTTTAGIGATWVGIGGVNSRDLIQAGTQDVTSGGQHQFQSWIEMLPAASQQVPLAVAPGDSITVSIIESAPGSGQWSISMKNNTTGQSYQTNVQYTSSQSSAEWIEEAPASVNGNATTIAPLDSFGTISFTGVTAVENGQTIDMTQAGAQAITMANASNQALAVPSVIGSDGSSFTVTRTSAPASVTPIGSGRGQRGGGPPPASGR